MPRMPPVRAEKLALADARAVEEQKEREADTKGMPQKPLPLAGGAKKILSGMTKKAAAAEPSEAEGYGRQLMEHISKLHGGAYGAAFMKGMSAYGNPDVSAAPVSFDSNVPQKAADAPKPLKGKGRMVGAGVLKIEHGEEEMEGCGTKKGQMRKTARKAFEGMGKLKIEHGEESASDEEMEGGLRTGRFEGEGKVDHRRSRAAVVKRVMDEKHMKMAEASKYVKEHGLWKRE